MANEVRIRATVNDQVSGPLNKMRDRFDNLGKSGGFKSLVQGVGMGAGIAAFGLLNDAAGKAVEVLGDSVQAALEDERSVSKLSAALKANVVDWDGNTKAIEKAIDSRVRLGYSDDEQRDSLARLVAITKDSTKALSLQRTAMDLARLRGIDLATAGDIIGKVYGGNVSILRRYGIQIDKNASSTEALTAVEKLAQGQAEAYAATTEGKLLAAQLKFNEAMERLGYTLLPVVAEGADVLVRALDRSTVSIEDTLAAAEKGSQAAEAQLRAMGGSAKAAELQVEHLKGAAVEDLGKTEGAVAKLGEASEDMADEVKTAASRASDYYKSLRENLIDDTETLIDDVFDPIQLKLDAQANHFKLLADIQTRESAKGKEAINEATSDIVDDLDDQAQTLLDLGKRNKLTGKQVDQFSDDTKAAYAAIGKKVPPEIQKVINKLRTLAGFDGEHIRMTVDISQRTGGKGAHKGKALGGPVSGGTTYLVGEKGPELFTAPSSGTIIPNDKLQSVSGPGSQYHFHFHGVAYPPSPAQQQQMARTLGPALRDYLNRRG